MRTPLVLSVLALSMAPISDSSGTTISDRERSKLPNSPSDPVSPPHRDAVPDIVWFGGFDGSVAVQGGVWDFGRVDGFP